MAEIAGTALAAVSVGDPLIKAIRGLRRVYRATKNAPNSLSELEHTGNTIRIYLSQLDDDVKRNPSKCTSVFSQWLEDEKKVLTHSATEIKDFTCKVQNGLQKSTILGGVAYAMEESEIWKIQDRLASHISILEGMRRICENESIESRVAALELSDSKKLRARTTSSLEACSEYWCNVSSSMDETCSVDNESSYQEVLIKSKSYTRAAMRQLMSPSNIAAEPLVIDTTLTEGEVTSTSWENVNHVLAKTTDDSIKADTQSLQPFHSLESSSIYQSTLQLTTSSTHSSSSQRQGSSAYSGWSTQETAASISTPMTTQSDESFNGFGSKAQRHGNKLSVKVEVEGFGSRLVELDELGGDNLYDQVICVISTLREDILQSINKSQLKPSLRPKEQGIITYQTSEESEAGLTLLFNKGFLAGVVEALNNGDYTRLTVFATFILSELDEEQDQILYKLKTDSNSKTQWDPARFPSIDTVLKLANQPQQDAYAMNGHISSTFKWAYDSSAEFTVYRKPIFPLVHGGPEWAQKQTIAEGGSSTVYRVKFSKPHQSLSRGSEVYALKEFKQGHEHTFRREVEAYTQLAPKNHPHIVALLMAYELGGRFHLLFPWANGSLANFFQYRNPDPDPEITSWVALQCAGLADALQMIHTTSSNVPPNGRIGQPEANYGRHGDLKPENILWFASPSDQCGGTDVSRSLGTLKIADFGLSRLRSRGPGQTNSRSDKRFVGTLAYSAPDDVVSRKYDIWSLGMVYMEFVCWLLGGQESVKEFHHARCIGGDGRGYLTNKNGSVWLHPSLRDPRSWARSITQKRRLEGNIPSSTRTNWREYFLDIYCHLIEHCLDLNLTRRPSAIEVAQHLQSATNPLSIVMSFCFPEDMALTTRSPMQPTSHWAQTWAADLRETKDINFVPGVSEPRLEHSDRDTESTLNTGITDIDPSFFQKETDSHRSPAFDFSHHAIWDDLTIACGECNETFQDETKLLKHAKHQKHSPYACSCGIRFARNDTLTRHLKSFTEARVKYPCTLCKRHRDKASFRRRDHLVQHLRGYHKLEPEEINDISPPTSWRDDAFKALPWKDETFPSTGYTFDYETGATDSPIYEPGSTERWWELYDFVADVEPDQQPYWGLKPGLPSTDPFPATRAVEESPRSQAHDGMFFCMFEGCPKSFRRKADLDRHYQQTHTSADTTGEYPYYWKKGPRSRDSFHRRDHLREHFRDYHNEDLLRRGSNKEDEEWDGVNMSVLHNHRTEPASLAITRSALELLPEKRKGKAHKEPI
ncbi:hypothetical protein F5Y07DRAFT_399573 [Xylaria sp. FL0933]|nr:hypothetical protein F5Y07DRAFT_399573 [Xylaria sp. FL0933]